MESYDVVVVGAGNGGLTASTALAQKGLNVLLLERHNIPGGAATSFCRGRFEFEVALHQLSGMGSPEKPGPLRLLLDQIGVLSQLEFVEMSDLYSVLCPDGFRMALKPERELVVEELSARFPREKEAIKKFMDLCYDFSYQMLSVFFFKDPDASREKYPILYKYAYTPSIDVINDMFADPLLKAVISVYWGYLGIPPTRMSFAYLALLFFTYIEFKPYHLKGGSQALSNALAAKFASHGGTIRYNCGVDRILVENGAVKGVVTEHGDRIAADYVVSNASQVTTYVKMIGPDLVPRETLEEIRGRKLSTSAMTLYIGFDCEPDELGIEQSTNFLMAGTDITDGLIDRMRRVDIDDELLVLSCYDIADPDFSPAGACQASVVTLKYGENWMRIPPSRYAHEKFRVADAMLKRVEALYPGIRSHIEEIEVGTPLTHMRYLGHPNGAVYGYEQLTKDSMFLQPERKSPIEGLYFASGWAGDCGFQPTLEAGGVVAKAISKRMGA